MKSFKILMLGLMLVSVTIGGCIIDNGDSSLTIYNDSDYAIVEINLAPVDQVSWGSDLLHGDWLYPGESITIDYIDCDYYDVRIEDEDGWECITYDLDFCWDDDYWTITNSFLNNC